MKKIEWLNPNKMDINTGHKTFDKQTSFLTTGNVIGNTQLSYYIRPYSETLSPSGKEVPRGYLQNFDLNMFINLPQSVRHTIKMLGENQATILYEFRHFNKGKKIVHGYVLTSVRPEYKVLFVHYANDRLQSYKVIKECVKYISNETEVDK